MRAVDLVDVYSPERFQTMAVHVGLTSGLAADLAAHGSSEAESPGSEVSACDSTLPRIHGAFVASWRGERSAAAWPGDGRMSNMMTDRGG